MTPKAGSNSIFGLGELHLNVIVARLQRKFGVSG